MSQQGADLFFQAALSYGYQYIFGNPGTTEAAFMDALVRYPDLHFVLCLHENVATGAADGFARLTGWPAIVNLHLAPGLTNGLANVHNARQARVPMLVTIGEHDTRHLIEDSPLNGEIETLARTMCKWTWSVKDASELAAALHRATTIAMTAPQGPVCLILPTNMLTAAPLTPSGSTPTIPALHLAKRGPAASADIQKAAEVLVAAHHPLLLVGELDSEANANIIALAELTKAQIVYDSFPRRLDKAPMPNSSRLPYFPGQRHAMLHEIDVLVLIGVGGFTTLFRYEKDADPVVAAHTQVIQLEDDAEALGKNERSSLPLYGDIAGTLDILLSEVAGALKADSEKLKKPINAIADAGSPRASLSLDTTSPLSAQVLMQALHQILPPDIILIDEAITAREALLHEVLDAGDIVSTYLASRGGALGAGLPLAIGAQLGAPERLVVTVVGDGSAMYSIQALWTAAHYRLPILTIICNNASYDIIKLEMLRLQGTLAQSNGETLESIVGLGNPRLDFAQLAQGMGVRGWTVSETSQLLPSLNAALELCKSGAPALVDVHLTSLFGPR